jgi:hypothetical protein
MKKIITGLMQNVIRSCFKYKLDPDEIYQAALKLAKGRS